MIRRLLDSLILLACIPLAVLLLQKYGCNQDHVSTQVFQAINLLGLCPAPKLAALPSVIFTPEFRNILEPTSGMLPNPIQMSGRQLELGKVMVALEKAGDGERERKLEAIKSFDEQAQKAIRSLGNFNSASQLTLDTAIPILGGLIETLEKGQGKRAKTFGFGGIVIPLQDQIDAWVGGLVDQLQSYLQQSIETERIISQCYDGFQNILQLSGDAEDQGEIDLMSEDLRDDQGWRITPKTLGIDVTLVREPLARAIQDFELLVKEIQESEAVVSSALDQLDEVMRGFEVSPSGRKRAFIVDMGVGIEVKRVLENLKRLKDEVENQNSIADY
ncbi:hypothetical protein NP233_g12587 [Leucocoprinus birnbaumii]|uniref:Uncharacterized protein n=1 Tax=Leucocoprinus birnbaumii TaxID=56174 RepID=A0AAD5VER6_9AGAR|nr:hypothetical protein NP233_g12587 [Leucocoprinus birnbaumii]